MLSWIFGILVNGDGKRFLDESGASPDLQFDKSTSGIQPAKSHWAAPIDTPPFEAVPIEVHICFTFGGLQVNGPRE